MTEIDAIQIEIRLRNGSSTASMSAEGGDRATRSPEADNGASGVSSTPADLQRSGKKEAQFVKSVFGSGVSDLTERTLSSSLRHMVGAAAY